MCPNGVNKRLEQHVEFITFALNFKTICSFVYILGEMSDKRVIQTDRHYP